MRHVNKKRLLFAIIQGTLILGILYPASAWADHKKFVLGVVGDSISDEYSAPFGGQLLGFEGFEWVSILARERHISFGHYDETVDSIGLPGGYAFNHALKGEMLAGGNILGFFIPGIANLGQSFIEQAETLAQNFADGDIDAGVIQGGANDLFLHAIFGRSFAKDSPEFTTLKEGIIDALASILDTPVPGADTLADEAILVAQIPLSGDPFVDSAILDINWEIWALATGRGVPVFSMQAAIFARTNFMDPSLPVRIGELQIPLASVASSSDLVPPGDKDSVDDDQCGFDNEMSVPGCPTRAYQLNIFQDDRSHTTTIAQGFVANDVLTALITNYGFDVKLLTDHEILMLALGNNRKK